MHLEDWNREYRARTPLFGVEPTGVVSAVLAGIQTPVHALDLGCGDGRDTLHLLRAGHSVHAVDYSETAIEALTAYAQREGLARRLTTNVNDVRDFLPEPDSYGLVIGVTILDHIDEEAHIPLIGRMFRGLQDGGFIALEMYSDRDPSHSPSAALAGSEFAGAIRTFARRNYLLEILSGRARVLYYSDRLERDDDHGPVHWHGFTSVIARVEKK